MARIWSIFTIFTIAALPACSSLGSAPLAGPQSAGAQARADSAQCPTAVVYAVKGGSGTIAIYERDHLRHAPCGSISGVGSAQGLFSDSKGDLWVADSANARVYEFAPGTKSPTLTLSDPNGVPSDVTIDETSGTAYVTEYQNNLNAQTLVEVYAKGSTLPTATLGDPNARNGGFGAVDNQGNLYVTFMTQSNKAQVDEWIGGTGTPRNLGLQLISAGAIVTTKSGGLAICDPFAFRCGIFAPGSTKMSNVFGHMGRRGGIGPDKPPFLHPNALALERDERRTFVSANSLTEWDYPGPRHRPNHLPRVEIQVPGGAGSGIAVRPASLAGAPY